MSEREQILSVGGKRIIRALLEEYTAVLTMVVVWFGPYLAVFLRDDSRYFFLWDRGDSLSLLACMMLIAGAWLAIGHALHRWAPPAWARLFDHLFVVGIGAGALNNLAFHCTRAHGYSISQFGMEIQTGWIALVLITAFAYGRGRDGLVKFCRKCCLILSPGVAILAYQLLTLQNYPATLETMTFGTEAEPDASAGSPGDFTPVFLFVFDEWSYERTFPSGRMRPDMPHLRALAEESLVFHDAHSPGPRTKLSMPRLLFQTDAEVVAEEGRLGFVGAEGFFPAPPHATVFDAVGDRSYHTAIIGFLLPYRQWLGDQVDLCRAYPYYPRGENPAERVAMHLLKASERSTDPWLSFAYRKLNDGIQFRFFVDLHQRLTDDIESVLTDSPANTFAVFHYPLPHKPFMFQADGALRSENAGIFENSGVNYEHNLRQLDRVIGRFIGVLHRAGKYDDALIILTSDHTWRHDPAKDRDLTDDELTHVPLIVKLPGAALPGDPHGTMCTAKITPLISASLEGHEAVAALLDVQAESGTSEVLTRAEREVWP